MRRNPSERVVVDPGYLIVDAVDLGIMLGTGEGVWVFFDGYDVLEMAGESKSYGVAPGASK